MEYLTRLAEQPLPLRAAELLRRDDAHKAMAGRIRATLLDQPTPRGQGRQLASQPGQRSPKGAVVEKPPRIPRRHVRRILVNSWSASGTGRFAIALPVVLQIAGGEMQQGRPGVAFIGEYESRDNR